MGRPGVLLIDDGDLPSLAATVLDWRPQHVAIYHRRGADPAAACRETAAADHARVLGSEQVIIDRIADLVIPGAATAPAATPAPQARLDAIRDACVLLRATLAAARLGCRRIIWPVQVGPDPQAVGRVVQQADMAAELSQAGELVIDVPLVDLADRQVVDLAEDGGAPLRSFWPCARAGVGPCEQCEGCRRWLAAFEAAGVPWPWSGKLAAAI